MRRLVAFVGVFLSLSGCDGGQEIFVQVRTDYVPGVEFQRVRTSLLDTGRADVVFDVETGDSFVEPRRVADIGDVSEQITLEVSLEGADTIARRVVRAQVSESLGLTVVITRDCEGVVCGDPSLPTCHGGRCADDRCTEESAEFCPEAECTFDGDCMGGASCARALCTSGTCLLAGDDASCETTEYCDPAAGCMPLPGTVVDSGMPDTCTPDDEVCGGGDEDCDGLVDEGGVCAPVCDPGFGDCDEQPGNGCETRLNTVTDCGECGFSCPAGATCGEERCTIPSWALTFGGTDDDGAFAVVRDRFDGVFVVGAYEDSLDFGDGPLADTGTANGFVARLRTSGALDWAVGFDSGGGAHDVRAVTVDFEGNVYVGGGYTATSRFGGGTSVTNAGAQDAFIVSFDGEGVHRWTRNYGSTGDDLVRGLTVAEDLVLATGHFEDSVDFGGGALTSLDAQDVFILGLTISGAHDRSFAYGGPGQDSAYAIACDDGGNCYVTGGFEGSLTFGAPALMASGTELDIFVASVDAVGAHRWSNRYGGADADVGRDLVLDFPGVMVAGSVGAGADLGGGVRGTSGGTDFFLARYTASDGIHVSDSVRGGSGVDQAHALAMFGDTALLAGQVEGSVDFGAGVRPGAGGSEAFVAGYSLEGASSFSRLISGPSNDEAWGVAPSDPGIYVVGRFEGTVDFGAGPVTADGFDLFVTHMIP